MAGRFLDRVAEATGDQRYEEAAHLFHRSGQRWSELGAALLSLPADSGEAEGKQMVDLVIDTVEHAADHENRALSALRSV